jgi:hypothetical protein
MSIDIERIKRINAGVRQGVKLTIEKQDASKLRNGNVFHAGTLVDESGNEFDFTITEMKANGTSALDLTWCDGLPFPKERSKEPYTTEASDADLRRIAIGTMIVEEFTTMKPNAELED